MFQKTISFCLWPLSLLGCCLMQPSFAIEAIGDELLSEVAAQDGFSLQLSGPELTLTNYRWNVDQGVTSVNTDGLGAFSISPATSVRADNISLRSVDAVGNLTGAPYVLNFDIDVGNSASSPGTPTLAISGDWSRQRMLIDAYRHSGDLSKSMGTLAFDSAGSFFVSNAGGLFNQAGTNTARFSLDITDATLFFRQGAVGQPELVFDNIRFRPNFTNGRIGIDAQGLVVSAPVFNFDLLFDLRYDATPGSTGFVVNATDKPVMYFGWQGVLNDFEWRLRSGGVWYGTAGGAYRINNKSQGLNVAMRWNYDPSFAWVVGESEADTGSIPRVQLQFDQWQKLSGAAYGFNVPLFVIDAINAGQGPGGLCWGNGGNFDATACVANGGFQFLNIAPENNNIALVIRDAGLLAYSTRVRVLDDINNDGDYADIIVGNPNVIEGYAENQVFRWGLIYTFNNVDGNIYLYPGGAGSVGLKTDILLMSNTRTTGTIQQRFGEGTHFMIADTDQNFGIGFLNSRVLLAADDLFITHQPTGLNFQTSNAFRFQFMGTFGGGDIPNLNTPVRGAELNINIESNNFSFTLSPASGTGRYVGYSGQIDLVNLSGGISENGQTSSSGDDGTFISLAEPGSPNIDFRLANITGRLALQNGRLDLVSAGENVAPPLAGTKLVLSNDLLVGATAGGAPFQVGRVEFENRDLGTIVIPSGQIHSSLALKKQNIP